MCVEGINYTIYSTYNIQRAVYSDLRFIMSNCVQKWLGGKKRKINSLLDRVNGNYFLNDSCELILRKLPAFNTQILFSDNSITKCN